ncbi:hypothetical protein CIPAW_03G172800 [Carya illinoinensis]|uniref:No apical meristem-associated C-terminal domain-containing protein n=1 Tax=Carya illinoinensis TaxID=32201 RepID=A0A8T1R4R7_CARIL|nr:hypothetical protein CIPAW_03G172800 [Carya illinoinensis]
MDSQDLGHMYFTNLLSQDPQLEPTYGGQSGSSPMTLGDSPPLPPNESIGVRKSVRGANFTPEEDKLLVSAWLNCSLDAVQGTNQKHSQLWEKIFEYFQQYKETTNERTIKFLIHRWINLNGFGAPQRRIQNEGRRCPHPRMNEVIELDRLMERKAEKGKRKAQGKQAEENFQLRKMKYTMLEESRAQEKEFYRLKAEKMEYDKGKEEKKLRLEDERMRLEVEKIKIEAAKEQSKIRQEDERLRLEAEKVELAKKESDQRIMMIDVSVMPEIQRLYFEQLQREIIMRRSHAQGPD